MGKSNNMRVIISNAFESTAKVIRFFVRVIDGVKSLPKTPQECPVRKKKDAVVSRRERSALGEELVLTGTLSPPGIALGRTLDPKLGTGAVSLRESACSPQEDLMSSKHVSGKSSMVACKMVFLVGLSGMVRDVERVTSKKEGIEKSIFRMIDHMVV